MNNNIRFMWWLIGIIIVALVAWGIWSYASSQSTTNSAATTTSATSTTGTTDQADASQVVVSFGPHLKNVSLLAPDASTTIATEYGPFVDPSLLATWEADPSKAPGRQTSSPSPDSISVTSVASSGAGFVVQGNIQMVTSSGNAGLVPFSAVVQKENGQWYITSFVQGPTTAS